jgi:hypothetical protein
MDKKIAFLFDKALRLDTLPFKITIQIMLKIARWVQGLNSYVAAYRVLTYNPL